MRNESNVSGSVLLRLKEAPPLSASADAGVSPSNHKILICSRDSDTALLLSTIFELWNYQTCLSDGMDQAFEIIENLKPSLILIDANLPFATHLENIRQIRLQDVSKRLPVIVISGFSQSRFKNLSLDAGASAFLVKPLDFDLLESHLTNFIGKSHQNSLLKGEQGEHI